MDIYRLIKIIVLRLNYLVAIPLLAGLVMFLASRNQAKIYSSRASIFTAITSSPSIENLGNSRVDFFATKTAYNNLLSILSSRNVIEETALRLFTTHLMLEKASYPHISQNSYDELQQIIPSEIKKMVIENNPEGTYANLLAFMNQDKNNFIYGLLNYDHPHYSYNAISKNVKIQQIGSSDMVEISYELNDPGVVFQTLNILIEVFLREYSILKKNQTNAVVDYFEKQLKNSSKQLSTVEDNLLVFNKKNNIVNYYEQTKHISSQQEKIEIKLQDILLDYQSAEAVLKKLEVETQARFKININTKEVLKIRQALTNINQQLAKIETEKEDPSESTLAEAALEKQKFELQIDLQKKIDSLNVYARNSEGMNIDVLLNNWLKTVIEYEGAKARLQAMQKKNEEFSRLYARYAPLGATLKRIEREIEVKEKEYLEILHHLGLAKLKQQNEEMMANMKILDHPMLPINPKPTKRKLYIVVIVFFAFIFSILGILLFELLDKTIKNPKRFEELTKLKVAGVCAFVGQLKKVDFNHSMLSGLKTITESVINEINNGNQKPLTVQLLSHWQAEGKSFVMHALKEHLERIGYSVYVLQLNEYGSSDTHTTTILPPRVRDAKSYDELIDLNKEARKARVVFIEIPAVSDRMFNTALLKTASLSYLVADARRNWETADEYILRNQKNQITGSLACILNNVQPWEISGVTGQKNKNTWFKRSKNTVL